MKGHYHLLIVSTGSKADSFERVYLSIETVEETVEDETTTREETEEEAIERWIEGHPNMIDRQRNRAKVAGQLRASILEYRVCRPSSWYRENGLGAHAETTPKTTTTRRKK